MYSTIKFLNKFLNMAYPSWSCPICRACQPQAPGTQICSSCGYNSVKGK